LHREQQNIVQRINSDEAKVNARWGQPNKTIAAAKERFIT
jgi:hypothetical protein